jgi:hypothetical protein
LLALFFLIAAPARADYKADALPEPEQNKHGGPHQH